MGEFGMGPEGYKGFSQLDWFKAFFEHSRQAGAGGAMFWIITPDPKRGYGVTYTTPRDEQLRAEIRRASELFNAHQGDDPPRHLLDASRHLVPRQFAFERAKDDPITRPEIILPAKKGEPLIYRFTPEMAISARFEKMGGGMGYIWGSGVGYVEYLLPARDQGRWVKNLKVRAHVQPVLPEDSHPPVVATRISLLINGIDCGSRLVPVESPKQAIVEEWVVNSMRLRMLAGRGLPLTIRFAVKVDADAPFGLNISNYAEGHNRPNQKPIEVEVN
jgi:hypothetical protein